MAKSCPVSKEVFLSDKVQNQEIKIGTDSVMAKKKEFKSGSFGFQACGKVILMVNGVPVQFQLNGTLTAVGSKPAEQTAAAA